MVRVWTLGRICEDLILEMIAVDLGGGRRLWRHDAGFIISREKTPMVLPVSDHHASVCIQCVCVCVCVCCPENEIVITIL